MASFDRVHATSESYERLGCDVPKILKVMFEDQREHSYASFGETYLKVMF
jgi:hypothetical protein